MSAPAQTQNDAKSQPPATTAAAAAASTSTSSSAAAATATAASSTAVVAGPAVTVASSSGGGAGGVAPAPAPVDIRALYVFSNHKAGMGKVDSEYINSVIYEMSKNSPHFANQQRKHAAVTQKIEKMRAKLALIRSSKRLAAHTTAVTRRVEKLVAELHAARPLQHTWIHVDMDMFYAAVEIRDRPELAGQPVAVGGNSMISTSNYEARKYGVRAAMPGFIAKKLCPHLVFVHSNFDKYQAVADQTRKIFADYDPNFEAGSLDEAYLDITQYLNTKNANCADSGAEPVTGAFVASEIRSRIFAVTRLTASAGVGPNRMLSKICGEVNKPNGQFAIDADPQTILRFMDNLSVRKIPGIGQVMERVLKEIGIKTCKAIRDPENAAVLFEMFSEHTSRWLITASLGLGEAERSTEERERKSISCERTFREINTVEAFRERIRSLCLSLAEDIASHKNLRGKTVTLKMKNTKFEITQRSVTLSRYISSAADLTKYALQLLHEELERLHPHALPLPLPPPQIPTAPPSGAASTPAPAPASAPAPVVTVPPPASTTATAVPSAVASATPSDGKSTSPAAGAMAAPAAAAGGASSEPILRLRLMGVRLSSFHPSCDMNGGEGEAAGGGQKSIVKFLTKSNTAAAAAAASAGSTPVKPDRKPHIASFVTPYGKHTSSSAAAAAAVAAGDTEADATGPTGLASSAVLPSSSMYARANRFGKPKKPESAHAAPPKPPASSLPSELDDDTFDAEMERERERERVFGDETAAAADTSSIAAASSSSSSSAAAAAPAASSSAASASGSASSGEWLSDEFDGFHDSGSDRDFDADTGSGDDMFGPDGKYDFVYDCTDVTTASATSSAAAASASATAISAPSAAAAAASNIITSAAAAAADAASSHKRIKLNASAPVAAAAPAATTATPLSCPVCGRTDREWMLSDLNRHLDQCLNPTAASKPKPNKSGSAAAVAAGDAAGIGRWLKPQPPPTAAAAAASTSAAATSSSASGPSTASTAPRAGGSTKKRVASNSIDRFFHLAE